MKPIDVTTKVHSLVWLTLIGANFLFGASTWQSARIIDTGRVVEATGIGAFPAIALAILLNLIGIFTLRYARGFARAVLANALAIVTGLALFTASVAPFSKAPVLAPAVESFTGVAGWVDQQKSVLWQVSGYSVTSFIFSGLSLLLVLWVALGPLAKNTSANTTKTSIKDDLWIN